MATKKGYITHEEYEKLKVDTVEQSYRDTHKKTDWGLYIFSWFGNAASIFLAFFFMDSLFNSAFIEATETILLPIAIIFFLTMFELLKRRVFELFSKSMIRQGFNILDKHMWGYNLAVVILVGGSFYLSLSGAQKFMNKETVIVKTSEKNISTKLDSINKFYFINYIKPIQEENRTLNAQNNEYLATSKTMYATKYTSLIEQNNAKIKDNSDKLSSYEKERDTKLGEIKNYEGAKLKNDQSTNSMNIIIFIIISFAIECVIMIGIYFDKYYTYRVVKEYEQNVLDTPNRKRWKIYDEIAEVAFEGIAVGDNLPSANDIKDIIVTNGVTATPRDMDNFFKMMAYLKVIERRGSKRVLNMNTEKVRILLRTYYKIV